MIPLSSNKEASVLRLAKDLLLLIWHNSSLAGSDLKKTMLSSDQKEVCSLLLTEDLLISEHEAGVGGPQGVQTLLLPQHQAEVGARLLLPPILLQLGLVLYQLLAQTGASLDVVGLVETDVAVVELVKMACRGVEHLR